MIVELDDIQARAVLGAMKAIANGGAGGLNEMDRRTIKAASTIALGAEDVEPVTLTEPTPEELAAALTSADAARQVVRILAVMSLVSGVLEPLKMESLLTFAEALDVEEEYLEILEDATSGRIGRATDRLAQRGAETFLDSKDHDTEFDPVAPLMPYGDGNERPALEARYQALGDLPKGTFGREFYDHFNENDLDFPASESGQIETFTVPHDSAHVLCGYSTSEQGELLVATFLAAMHDHKPMESQILPAMFSWHLGIKLSWLGGAYRGAFEPQSFWTAWVRGKSTQVDLFEPDWGFWPATGQPLEEVRRACGVPSLDASLCA